MVMQLCTQCCSIYRGFPRLESKGSSFRKRGRQILPRCEFFAKLKSLEDKRETCWNSQVARNPLRGGSNRKACVEARDPTAIFQEGNEKNRISRRKQFLRTRKRSGIHSSKLKVCLTSQSGRLIEGIVTSFLCSQATTSSNNGSNLRAPRSANSVKVAARRATKVYRAGNWTVPLLSFSGWRNSWTLPALRSPRLICVSRTTLTLRPSRVNEKTGEGTFGFTVFADWLEIQAQIVIIIKTTRKQLYFFVGKDKW